VDTFRKCYDKEPMLPAWLPITQDLWHCGAPMIQSTNTSIQVLLPVAVKHGFLYSSPGRDSDWVSHPCIRALPSINTARNWSCLHSSSGSRDAAMGCQRISIDSLSIVQVYACHARELTGHVHEDVSKLSTCN